jgi:hypothetical protein
MFQAILISPLFFGIAHFHHMVERIRKGGQGCYKVHEKTQEMNDTLLYAETKQKSYTHLSVMDL